MPTRLQTVRKIIDQGAAKHPDRPFLIATEGVDEYLTWSQLQKHAKNIDALLDEEGIEVGDTVAFLLDNGYWTTILLLGVMYSGRVILALNALSGSEALTMYFDAIPETTKIIDTNETTGPEITFPSLNLDKPQNNINPDSIAILMYTSGTTGKPKGSALSPAKHQKFEKRFGIHIVETMGLTETAAQILSNPMPPKTSKYGSPGIAFGNEAKIIKDDGSDAPNGTIGELMIRGDNVMQAYEDEDGFFFITGRLKELIIKGGENIAPREIDDILYGHPAVLEAAAFGIDDDHYGQEVMASVALCPGMTKHLMNPNFIELAKQSPKRIVLPESSDNRILEAAVTADQQGIAEIILLGDSTEITNQLETLNLSLGNINIVNPNASDNKHAESYAQTLFQLREKKGMTQEQASEISRQPLYYADLMVNAGDADACVAGVINSTGNVFVHALQVLGTEAPGARLSSFFIIAKHEAVDKVSNATKLVKEQAPELTVIGDIQLDAAMSKRVLATKWPDSEFQAPANVFVFPSLEAGNIGYKIAERFGSAIAVGPILQGLAKPVNDLSRGSDVEAILNTIAVTCLQCD
ncbi:Phosphate acetyltransferase [Nymphon striatum]|nr:Phosphate acetyltransferase [Nymphon striatum]